MRSGKDEREEFSDRLISALIGLGWVKMSPTRLAEQFNIRAGSGCGVTIHAARKWLHSGAIPTQERLAVLAAWLEVQPDWLRFGTADEDEILASADLNLLQDFAQLDKASKVLARDVMTAMLKASGRRTRHAEAKTKRVTTPD